MPLRWHLPKEFLETRGSSELRSLTIVLSMKRWMYSHVQTKVSWCLALKAPCFPPLGWCFCVRGRPRHRVDVAVCWGRSLRYRHLRESWRPAYVTNVCQRLAPYVTKFQGRRSPHRTLSPPLLLLQSSASAKVLDGCIFLKIHWGYLPAASASHSEPTSQEILLNT